MVNREEKLELAIRWMEQLNVLKPCRDALKRGELWQSEGAGVMSGILYTASEETVEKAKEIEDKYNVLVWHAIKGVYIFGGTDRFEVSTYLLVADEDVEMDHRLQTADLNNYYALAYVDNETDPMLSELGEVAIANANGGLRRVQ